MITTIEHEIERWPSQIERWPSQIVTFKDPIHAIAERIGRQEITLEGAYEASAEAIAIYIYDQSRASDGLDSWIIVDTVDKLLGEYDGQVEIWFGSGYGATISVDIASKFRWFVQIDQLDKVNG